MGNIKQKYFSIFYKDVCVQGFDKLQNKIITESKTKNIL